MEKLAQLGNSQKKLLAGLVLVFIITLSIGFIFLRKKKDTEAPIQAPIIAEKETQSSLLEDTDHDGLLNWEEELYKTDPNNPDTDGDGTPDGEELKLGRDPTKAGPHDTIAEIKKETATRAKITPNLTQSLFGDFVKQGGANSLLLQKDPERASQLIIAKVLEYQQLGKLPQDTQTPPELPLPSVRTSENTSEEAIKKYLNDVGLIFEEDLTPLREDDLGLFLAMLQSGNFDRLNKLKNYSLAVERAARKMRSLAVPQNLAWFHAKEISYLETTWGDLQKFTNIEKDPLSALLAVTARKKTKIAMIKLHYGELREWLNKNNISLQPQDKAYRLYN